MSEAAPTAPTAPTTGRWVWMNGEIREAAAASISIWANGAHYGTGVFEGIRCYPTARGPAVFRLLDHMKRLVRSAKFYSLRLRWSAEELSAATLALLAREGTASAYVRPLVFFGEGSPHLTPKKTCPTEALIMTRALGAFMGDENFARGIRCTVSSWRKVHSSSLPTTAKGCGHYTNSVIAAQEAMDRGFDEALLLNQDGTVAEGTGENIFFLRDGKVVTNDASSSILMGITRDSVITLMRDDAVPVEVRPFTLTELLDADEVFLTGTAAEVTPVREIEGRAYPTGPGTFSARMQARYHDVVQGKTKPEESRASGQLKYDGWLSYVRAAT